MNEKNMIWRTDEDPEQIGEYEIARNIEVRNHENGIEIRVTQQTLRTDAVSLPKVLDWSETLELIAELLDAVQKQLGRAEEER